MKATITDAIYSIKTVHDAFYVPEGGQMGMNQTTDSYSRNIQNQIANAQKQLQEISSNEDTTLEEKMKKRQWKYRGRDAKAGSTTE